MTEFKTGWKRDLDEHLEECVRMGAIKTHVEVNRQGAAALASSVKPFEGLIDIRDQMSTSSCVGFAIAGALQTRLRRVGHNPDRFSPLAIYAVARQLEGLYKNAPLPDTGSYPFLAMNGLKRFGIVPESAWAFGSDFEKKVEKELPFDVFASASQFRVSNFSRIDSKGAARTRACMEALAKGHPVVLGMHVGSEFQRYQKGNDPVGIEMTNTGGHMTYLVGYEDNGEVFLGANSWTRDWGDDGLYKITRAKLEHDSTEDLYDFVVTEG